MNIEEIKNTIGKREIEYRCWSKDLKKIYEVNTIHLNYGEVNCDNLISFKLKDVVLVQYTGLLDKNGKKIFEGDIIDGDIKSIVMIGGYKCEVSGENGFGVYINIEGKTIGSETLLQDEKNIDVIGNIFQNK